MSGTDLAPRADRVEHALRRRVGVTDVVAGVFAAVGVEVAHTFACLATTDPVTGVISWAYKSRSLDVGDEEFAAFEYGEPDVNQFAEVARREVPVAVLSVDTDGHPEHCRRFREFLAPRFGFTDEVRVVFRTGELTWGALALYRGAGEPPFSARDAAVLAAVRRPVTDALRRALFSAGAPGDDVVPDPAVVVVDGQGRPRDMTRAARERIEDLGGWDHGSLPSGVIAVAAQARRVGGVSVARTRLTSGRWLVLRASPLEGAGDGTDVVVTIDLARPADMSRLTLAARGLTVREQEVTALVTRGASTKAVSAALHLSPHTVQDHLKSIFVKLGVNSRRELISGLLDADVAAPG